MMTGENISSTRLLGVPFFSQRVHSGFNRQPELGRYWRLSIENSDADEVMPECQNSDEQFIPLTGQKFPEFTPATDALKALTLPDHGIYKKNKRPTNQGCDRCSSRQSFDRSSHGLHSDGSIVHDFCCSMGRNQDKASKNSHAPANSCRWRAKLVFHHEDEHFLDDKRPVWLVSRFLFTVWYHHQKYGIIIISTPPSMS